MIPSFVLADLYLLGRLTCLRKDRPRSFSWVMLTSLFESIAASAILRTEASSAWFLVVFGVLTMGATRLDRQTSARPMLQLSMRLLSLLVGLLVLSTFARISRAEVRPELAEVGSWVQDHWGFGHALDAIHWTGTLVHTFGLLLCLLESSTVVALCLHWMSVGPPTDGKNHFKHSSLIGAVERLLIYIFAFNGAFNAVAFVLTAKTVARLHETFESDAAEYVLLGTLVSTLTAITIALFVTRLV